MYSNKRSARGAILTVLLACCVSTSAGPTFFKSRDVPPVNVDAASAPTATWLTLTEIALQANELGEADSETWEFYARQDNCGANAEPAETGVEEVSAFDLVEGRLRSVTPARVQRVRIGIRLGNYDEERKGFPLPPMEAGQSLPVYPVDRCANNRRVSRWPGRLPYKILFSEAAPWYPGLPVPGTENEQTFRELARKRTVADVFFQLSPENGVARQDDALVFQGDMVGMIVYRDDSATRSLATLGNIVADTGSFEALSAEPAASVTPEGGSAETANVAGTRPGAGGASPAEPPVTTVHTLSGGGFVIDPLAGEWYARQACNVRSGPGTNHERIGSLRRYEVVKSTGVALADDGRRWIALDLNGAQGFVAESLLRRVR